MPQTRLYFTAGRDEANRISAALELAFEEEAYPLALVELDEDKDIHEVSLYTEDDPQLVMQRIRDIAGDITIEQEILPDIDWVKLSLEGLKPVRAGRFFVHGAHDRDKCRSGDLNIQIEAGLAFGTGHHGTTWGCLEMIDAVTSRERPGNALDLGTGSAVLAIALAKLAHIPVLATDIDPDAIAVARENVLLNGVADYVETVAAPGFHHPVFTGRAAFDLIVANILAQPLIQLAPEMARFCVASGSLILSGILERQHDAVVTAYIAQAFSHVQTLQREGWVTIHLRASFDHLESLGLSQFGTGQGSRI